MDPLIVGFGVGVLVGVTGMGGGSLMTPILIIVFGFKPVTAVGTDLAYGAVTKTVGGWRHFRQHTVNTDVSTWMAFGSVPAAVLGVYVLHLLQRAYGADFDNVMITAVACALLFTGVGMSAPALVRRPSPPPMRTIPRPVRRVATGSWTAQRLPSHTPGIDPMRIVPASP